MPLHEIRVGADASHQAHGSSQRTPGWLSTAGRPQYNLKQFWGCEACSRWNAHAAQTDENAALVRRQVDSLQQRLPRRRIRRGADGVGGRGAGAARLLQVLQVEGVDAVRVCQRDARLRWTDQRVTCLGITADIGKIGWGFQQAGSGCTLKRVALSSVFAG